MNDPGDAESAEGMTLKQIEEMEVLAEKITKILTNIKVGMLKNRMGKCDLKLSTMERYLHWMGDKRIEKIEIDFRSEVGKFLAREALAAELSKK